MSYLYHIGVGSENWVGTRSLVVCVCFVDRCLSLVLFVLATALSVPLRYKVEVYKAGEKFEDTRRGNQKP
jgi:hypothetical protein